MATPQRSFRKVLFKHLNPLWSGTGQTWLGLLKLVWAILRFLLASWVWDTAVRLARFQRPIKTGSIILALVSLAFIIWALWGFWQSLSSLGLKRLVVTIVGIYGLVVIINLLTVPNTQPFVTRLLTQLDHTGRQAWSAVINLSHYIGDGPDEFLFAYTGQRSPPKLPPGYPTPNPNATPIQVFVGLDNDSSFPTTNPTQQSTQTAPLESITLQLRVGGYARVTYSDGKPLRARSGPGTTFEIIARFPEGTRLLVLEGPKPGREYTWWKVRGEQGEGWCAELFLEPVAVDN